MISKIEYFILIFITLFSYSKALYRSLYLNRQKCYKDHYYSEMNVIMQLKIEDYDLDFSMKKDDRFIIKLFQKGIEEPIQIFQTGKRKSKFSYSISNSGEYIICITSTDKNLYKDRSYIQLNFITESSEDAISDINEVAKMKDFNIVDEKIKKIMKKTENIEKMQKYQIKNEDDFAQNQMNSSQILFIVTIIQLVICVIIGVYHFFSMKKIFKQKMWSPF